MPRDQIIYGHAGHLGLKSGRFEPLRKMWSTLTDVDMSGKGGPEGGGDPTRQKRPGLFIDVCDQAPSACPFLNSLSRLFLACVCWISGV